MPVKITDEVIKGTQQALKQGGISDPVSND